MTKIKWIPTAQDDGFDDLPTLACQFTLNCPADEGRPGATFLTLVFRDEVDTSPAEVEAYVTDEDGEMIARYSVRVDEVVEESLLGASAWVTSQALAKTANAVLDKAGAEDWDLSRVPPVRTGDVADLFQF